MEKPLRYIKKLINFGHSVGVIIPQIWMDKAKLTSESEIVVEVYTDKVVILPVK